MIMMPRDRSLTILTDNQLKTNWGHDFKSPCLRALNLYDGVNGYVRLLDKGYLFIADEEDHVQLHKGFFLISDDSMPDVLWFKEPYDRVTILGEFYI